VTLHNTKGKKRFDIENTRASCVRREKNDANTYAFPTPTPATTHARQAARQANGPRTRDRPARALGRDQRRARVVQGARLDWPQETRPRSRTASRRRAPRTRTASRRRASRLGVLVSQPLGSRLRRRAVRLDAASQQHERGIGWGVAAPGGTAQRARVPEQRKPTYFAICGLTNKKSREGPFTCSA
jgi:hypothetical protein